MLCVETRPQDTTTMLSPVRDVKVRSYTHNVSVCPYLIMFMSSNLNLLGASSTTFSRSDTILQLGVAANTNINSIASIV